MTDTARPAVKRAVIVALVVLVLLLIGAGRTIFSRQMNARAIEATAAEQGRVYVKVATPRRGNDGQTVVLPGTLQGATQAPISSRASGYLRRWTKDIGATVQQGELLAEIDSPEIDQQLVQAAATTEQLKASMALAKSTLDRSEALRKQGMVSLQDLDEKRSSYAQAQANLAAASANVERLKQLEGFKRVVAPFRGIITRRNVDVGDLIDGGSGRPLFILTQGDALRVYVNVPQSYANQVKAGQKVTISQAELRGKTFEATVARTAQSIDPATRTMQVEVALDNRAGELLPGAYVQVSVPLPASKDLIVPAHALVIRGQGVQVATVDAASKVKLVTVNVGRNFGPSVEVLSGLSGGERLVLNPPDSLANGDTVTIVPEEPKKG